MAARNLRKKCKGLWACLFTTAFLFCFGLLALYKYTIIDADSVLLKNNGFGGGGSFDYDDYGIDVSSIRSGGDVNSSDPVEKWNKLVREDGGVRMGYVTDNCDKPTTVQGVAYLTKNKNSGLKVVVVVNYTSEKQVNKGDGEAVILAKFGKVIALNQTLELCSIDEELLQCPMKKGFESYRREVILPQFAPKGQYHGTVSLRYTDTKEVKLCAKGRMIL